jgi:hypothetical protein
MSSRSFVLARTLVQGIVGLTLLVLPLACRSEAQGANSQAGASAQKAGGSTYSPLTYRLDEATVRKVAAVMREWDPKGPPPKTDEEAAAYWGKLGAGADFGNKVGREFVDKGTTTEVERIPELKAAIARQGLTLREFVQALLAYSNAMGYMDVEGMGFLDAQGRADAAAGKPGVKASGVFKENIELLRRNKQEELPNW